MKCFSYIFMAGLLILILLACTGLGNRNRMNSGLIDGEYEGTAWGYRGLIHLRITINKGIISEIEILECSDDRFVGLTAIEELQELALIFNTSDLDAISGATESSYGFLAALSNALEKARQIPPNLDVYKAEQDDVE